MSLHYYFRDSYNNKPKLWKPSSWLPPHPKHTKLRKYFEAISSEIFNSELFNCPYAEQNLSVEEYQSLMTLQSNKNIIIKPADKGGSIVVMNKSDYIQKAIKLLGSAEHYKTLTMDPTNNIRSEVSSYVDHLYHKGHVSKQLGEFLQPPIKPRTPLFYGLPKIHKPDIPLRPIVSANESPTENISAFVDHICQPLMKALPSYIRDTKDFLRKVLNIRQLPPGAILVTADVVSLYTNIPHEEGIAALLKHMDDKRHLLPPDSPPKHCISMLMEFILRNNCFQFDKNFYQQILGTAMGSKCAPPYSCIFMGEFENNLILPLSELIRFWKRFIDDIFFIFLGNEEELEKLMMDMNNLHPSIKFNFKFSKTSIDFLDTTIYINNEGLLCSTLYTKPTDTSALLRFESFHPDETKTSIVYSQALRYRMLITDDELLKKELKKLKLTFIFRGYPAKLINQNINKICGFSQQEVLKDKPRSLRGKTVTNRHNKDQVTPKRLVFTFPQSRHTKTLRRILLKHWHYIASDPQLANIWDKPPTIAIKRHRNLRDILVRTKL